MNDLLIKVSSAYPNQIKEGKATLLTWTEALVYDDEFYINKAFLDYERNNVSDFAPKIAYLRAVANEFCRSDEADKKMRHLRIEEPEPRPLEGEALANHERNIAKARAILSGKITSEELENERLAAYQRYRSDHLKEIEKEN